MTVLYSPLETRRICARNRAGLALAVLLLALAMAGALLALRPTRLPQPAAKLASIHPPRAAMPSRPIAHPAPAGPSVLVQESVFTQESGMTPKALMARWEPAIADASKRFSVPKDWIRAVMRMESGGRTMMGERLPITSTAGAVGIMQVMPDTYNDMRGPLRLGPDAYDPHDNVIAGTAYLKWLSGKYGNPGMFAAYNDGPGNWESFMADRHALPAETHAYVAGIARMIGGPDMASMTHAQLTRPDGTPVTIDAQGVSAVRAPLPGEYADSVQAVVATGRQHQGVRESVMVAITRLKAHGARL
jgi:soluble lytic murein transglycosylase-like protein